ncbi:SPOR domain-containing protein [Sulfuriferula nivalis]|uniref:Cell division protein n=1 Tax=Sulfuriferula nivalis TaxID=2675298 RepID=A0A809RC64_9PROT|nr:SPOR domain-containing protein [Sulfuriferula nivalis]BBO99338.1 cell division protein [Sulfuriferula nivalis]
MARDYKSRTNERKSSDRRSGGSSVWSGILIGLAVGLIAAVAVAYWVGRSNPFDAREKATAAKAVDEQAHDKKATGTVIDPLAKATNTPDKPEFDFYKILPGKDNPAPNADTAKTVAPDTLYFVQAGAFPNPEDADNLKARLALMGFEASIQATEIPDKGTWHRVRLGPYKLDEANKTHDALEQNKITASLIKIPAKAGTKTN